MRRILSRHDRQHRRTFQTKRMVEGEFPFQAGASVDEMDDEGTIQPPEGVSELAVSSVTIVGDSEMTAVGLVARGERH
jgi:hypothetical protein